MLLCEGRPDGERAKTNSVGRDPGRSGGERKRLRGKGQGKETHQRPSRKQDASFPLAKKKGENHGTKGHSRHMGGKKTRVKNEGVDTGDNLVRHKGTTKPSRLTINVASY